MPRPVFRREKSLRSPFCLAEVGTHYLVATIKFER